MSLSTSTNRCNVQGKRKTNKLIGTEEEFTIRTLVALADNLWLNKFLFQLVSAYFWIYYVYKKQNISKVQFSFEFKVEIQ